MDDDWAISAVNHSDLEQVAGYVGPDEPHESLIEVLDEHRVIERVQHVVVVDAVLSRTGCDQRRSQAHKVACTRSLRKLACIACGSDSRQLGAATEESRFPVDGAAHFLVILADG